jgi:curved DNA-binding protein
VPAGTKDGKIFRFRNLGAPNVKRKGSTGALLVTVQVEVPTNLGLKERETLKRLLEEDKRSYRPQVESYLKKKETA